MPRILVADDERHIRRLIEVSLTRSGYEVLQACDGQEAMQILEREPIDLLLTDVLMPRCDGHRLVQVIRERDLHSDKPIILVTADSRNTLESLHVAEIRVDDVIYKPFNPRALVEKVRSHLK